MKDIKAYVFSIAALLMMTNCTKEKDHLFEQAEAVMPGLWRIDSLRLPSSGMGIHYLGKIFYADTTLLNVGSVQINPFSSDSIDFNESRLDCELNIYGEMIPISMNTIFVSGKDLWTYFRYNGPDGLNPIDTPIEEFYWSSQIFNVNYIIEIMDSDNMRLLKGNDVENHVITLSRL